MHIRARLILGILVVVNLVLAGYVGIVRWSQRSAVRAAAAACNTSAADSKVLPPVDLHSDKGQQLSTRQFLGTPLLVQFVNPAMRRQTDLVSEVLRGRPKQPMTLLFVTSSAQELRQRVPGIPDDVFVVEQNFKELRKTFQVPELGETTTIFDKTGNVVGRFYYYQGGLVAKIRSAVDGEAAFEPELFQNPISEIRKGQIETIRKQSLNSESGTAIAILFSSVCTSCSSSDLVDVLNQRVDQAGVKFLVLLPKTFNRADINNFKANLGLKVPVAVADEEVSRVWDSLTAKYGQRQVNGIVIVMKRGTVSVLQGATELSDLLASMSTANAKS